MFLFILLKVISNRDVFVNKIRFRKLILSALFAALTAVLSQIVIPIGPVPINFATFSVFCAGALLGAKFGAFSMILWVAIGVAGVPVFTMFRGGFGALLGPTGGYIAGYIPAAFVIGLLVEYGEKNAGERNTGESLIKKKIVLYPLFMIAGMFIYFILGTAWFMFSLKTGFRESLMICVIPFLPGEFIKVICATALVIRIRPFVNTCT